MKERLAIFLITYNRKHYLKRTLDQFFSEESPVKEYAITILDNASTDGTYELIEEYCAKYPNLTHVRHGVNIGGNANICRAYEMGAACGKEYVWVIADDDKYDFTHWNQVEEAANQGADIICLADYIFPDKESRGKKQHQIMQLTFVPAGIYKTSLITNSVLMAMYDAIYTMFSQSCLTIYAIEHNRKITVCDKPIVFNGLHFEDHTSNNSYTRGASKKFVLARRRDTTWLLGFSNVLSLLSDDRLKVECMDTAIHYEDICRSEEDLKQYMLELIKVAPNYFVEIYNLLPEELQRQVKRKTLSKKIVGFFRMFFDIRNEYVSGKKIKIFTFFGITYKKVWR
ncbi:MAG: glycosyltransferase family 2 protein [Bacteroidaceae bacterium]|nr:glycosyltransferase family 2 protein [Bacteroidaceae bacterium]